MDNWRLSWHPSLISCSASLRKLSGMVQGVPNWEELRQPCFKKRGKLDGFCLTRPLAYDWHDSGSIQVLIPSFSALATLAESSCILRKPLLPAPCFINYSPAYLWTISFRHLSSSYFLMVRVFLNLNFHFHFEVSHLIILSLSNWFRLLLPFPTLSIPFPSGSHCHTPCMLSLLSPLPHDCIGKSADPGILG